MKKSLFTIASIVMLFNFQSVSAQNEITIMSNPVMIEIECDNSPEGYDTQLINDWINNYISTAEVINLCSDPDDSYTWTHDYSGQTNTGGCYGVIDVEFTVTNSCGEYSTESGMVMISDLQSPILNPPSISEHTLLCDANGDVVGLQEIIDNNFYFDPPTDNCSENLTLEYNLPNFTCDQMVSVYFNVIDDCGNPSNAYSVLFNIVSLNVEFSAIDFPVGEGDGSTLVCLTLDNPSPQEIIAEVTYTGGTAESGVDFPALPAMQDVTFPANSIDEQCLTVNLLEDMMIEPHETITFEISNVTSTFLAGIGGVETTKITILDNDDNDNDNIENTVDNCPDNYNPFQEDFDNDLIGDVCDSNTTISEISEFQDYIYINRLYSGIIVKSLDGQCWVMVVQNDGSLNTVSVACPD